MADLAYTIAGNVLDKLGSLAYQEVSLAWGMKQDLDKLKLITLALQDVLLDAETKQEKNPQLKNWLCHLKDVFHEAVDVLDEFECELLRRQVVKQYGSSGRKVCRFFHGPILLFIVLVLFIELKRSDNNLMRLLRIWKSFI
uniref:Disease resistance N-terminal domain-containing protein n=1 Tax=Cannabis sativa TaxID=3483 RepID=A0A803R5W1_CANSA